MERFVLPTITVPLSQGFCCFFGQHSAKIMTINVPSLIHEMHLEHQEELDIKWIVEGRANQNVFSKRDFFKLRSEAPAWVTPDSTHFIASAH